MMSFEAFHSASATLDGIETAHMISKGQLNQAGVPAYQRFIALAG
jgi:putative transposase